jgi:hypothetical protein
MEEQHSERTGHCLCGAVTLTAHQASNHVGACHCTMCRRWGGGPYVEVNCGTNVSFTGEDHIGTFGSSAWAERGFCKTCGTHLFYRVKETGQCMVPAGLFDDDQDLAMQLQVFIDEKPAYYDFANETETMTGKEVFEKFG